MQLGEATNDIAGACGNALQLGAFGGSHARGLDAYESAALTGVHKLVRCGR